LEKLVNRAVAENQQCENDGTWIEILLCQHVSTTTLDLILAGRIADHSEAWIQGNQDAKNHVGYNPADWNEQEYQKGYNAYMTYRR
jgi:hypothetical protein